MRTTLSATLTAVTLCATPISARIYGIAAPAQLGAGDTVALKILTQNYIQAEQDVAMAFGLQPGNSSYPSSLGLLLGETFIGPANSNIVQNITYNAIIPETTAYGPTVLSGALLALVGVLNSPIVQFFSVNVTVGDVTTGSYISSS